MSKIKNILIKFIKPIISILLICSLFKFSKVTTGQIFQVFNKANLLLCLIAFVVLVASNFISGYRWKLLAKVLGFNLTLIDFTKFYLMGLFFNLFLPSTIGGDFSRCYYLSKDSGNYTKALSSVLADRFIGLSVLFLFASFGLVFAIQTNFIPSIYKILIVSLTAIIFVLVPIFPKIVGLIFKQPNFIFNLFHNSSLSTYWKDRNLIFATMTWSVILQTVIVICHVLIGYALGLTSIPFWYYFIFYPIVAVLAFIVPSINGLGIREWAYTYFLGLAGVNTTDGVTYAFIWLALNTLTSVVGGIIYYLGDFRINPALISKIQHERI